MTLDSLPLEELATLTLDQLGGLSAIDGPTSLDTLTLDQLFWLDFDQLTNLSLEVALDWFATVLVTVPASYDLQRFPLLVAADVSPHVVLDVRCPGHDVSIREIGSTIRVVIKTDLSATEETELTLELARAA